MVKGLEVTFKLMGDKVDFQILLFCTLLGALVYGLGMSEALANTVKSQEKNQKQKVFYLSYIWSELSYLY